MVQVIIVILTVVSIITSYILVVLAMCLLTVWLWNIVECIKQKIPLVKGVLINQNAKLPKEKSIIKLLWALIMLSILCIVLAGIIGITMLTNIGLVLFGITALLIIFMPLGRE